MNGELRGGLLVLIGVLAGWWIFDTDLPSDRSPSASDSSDVVRAIDELRASLETRVDTRSAPSTSESAPTTRREPSTSRTETPDLESIGELLDRLEALTVRRAREVATGTVAADDLRAGTHAMHPQAVFAAVQAANAAAEYPSEYVTAQWLLASPQTVLHAFGRPSEIYSSGVESWIYETQHPQTGRSISLSFYFSSHDRVLRVDCSDLEE
ncbi:MAG: hypothetical protein AAF196_14800 [Planctomycetota bacterium]